MRKIILIILAVFGVYNPSFAQKVKMRDVFANMPDSIFPLITKNNRLDCIDFIENDMPAQVKNRVEEPIELKSLTENYLKLKMSEVSHAEMKLITVSDTSQLICVVKTYAGPVMDSSVRFYTQDWEVADIPIAMPDVEAFISGVPEAEQNHRRDVVAMLHDMPFVAMSLSPDNELLILSLQAGELIKKEREWVMPYLKELKISLR